MAESTADCQLLWRGWARCWHGSHAHTILPSNILLPSHAGLPEHASSFRLKTTRGENAAYSEPYRLYNLDVFEYELDEPMALYGSIPFVASHTPGNSMGALFFNPCETFVDVQALVRAWKGEGPTD